MAKHPTYPTIYDEVIKINISKLKKWGYLQAGQIKKGSLKWSRNGALTNSVAIKVNIASVNPYLELDYTCGGLRINYCVPLVSVPSNLGVGRVWYFLCPVTGKRCRKLYSVGAEFLHRQAFRDCMYESQRRSHKERKFFQLIDKYNAAVDACTCIATKYYKSHYAEKPTRRHIKILGQIMAGKDVPVENGLRY